MNRIRGLLAEFGPIVPQGASALRARLPEMLENADIELPDIAGETLAESHDRWPDHGRRLADYKRRFQRMACQAADTRRPMRLSGVGTITATAVVASGDDLRAFRNGRQFCAWLGPRPSE